MVKFADERMIMAGEIDEKLKAIRAKLDDLGRHL
jgi:hypothetical protein